MSIDHEETVNSEDQIPQGNLQVITLDSISSIIKDAVGGVKEYIDEALTATKKQVREKVELKFIGNRIQYEFNIEQKEKIEKAIGKIQKGDGVAAITELKAVVSEINTRNKHIKLADRSEYGWKVVDEYKSEELADNSDDEKHIRSAIKSAAAKSKAKPKTQTRRAHPYSYSHACRTQAPETYPNPDSYSSGSFRRYNNWNRYSVASTSTARPGDYCFSCGKTGHWRRNCPVKTAKEQNNQQ